MSAKSAKQAKTDEALTQERKDEDAEAKKRSEAAKKAARTRKRNQEADNGDDEPERTDEAQAIAEGGSEDRGQDITEDENVEEVHGHREPDDGSGEDLDERQAEHSARKEDPLPHESHVDDPHAGRANDDSEVAVRAHREADARGEVDKPEPFDNSGAGTLPPVISPGAEFATGRSRGSAEVFLQEQEAARREVQAGKDRIAELEEQLENEKADRKRDHGKGKGPDAGVQAIAQLNRIRKIAQENGHVSFVEVLDAYEDSGLDWSEHERSTAGV